MTHLMTKQTVKASRPFLTVALLLGLLTTGPWYRAHAAQATQAELTPLETLLNPDGTLDLGTGFCGALDPSGCHLEYASDGTPRFTPAREPAAPHSLADTWNALGSGLNSWVSAIAVAGVDVYTGGAFTNAGDDANCDYLARWDGSAWHTLGSGLNNRALAIAAAGPDVYVGGNFTDAGGVANADHVARWDGSAWHLLGSGLNGDVDAIVVVGPQVYAGGWFTDASRDGEPTASPAGGRSSSTMSTCRRC